eukprot:Lankesteria_metandrocarpae@DN3367_c1_g1_i1.p1
MAGVSNSAEVAVERDGLQGSPDKVVSDGSHVGPGDPEEDLKLVEWVNASQSFLRRPSRSSESSGYDDYCSGDRFAAAVSQSGTCAERIHDHGQDHESVGIDWHHSDELPAIATKKCHGSDSSTLESVISMRSEHHDCYCYHPVYLHSAAPPSALPSHATVNSATSATNCSSSSLLPEAANPNTTVSTTRVGISASSTEADSRNSNSNHGKQHEECAGHTPTTYNDRCDNDGSGIAPCDNSTATDHTHSVADYRSLPTSSMYFGRFRDSVNSTNNRTAKSNNPSEDCAASSSGPRGSINANSGDAPRNTRLQYNTLRSCTPSNNATGNNVDIAARALEQSSSHTTWMALERTVNCSTRTATSLPSSVSSNSSAGNLKSMSLYDNPTQQQQQKKQLVAEQQSKCSLPSEGDCIGVRPGGDTENLSGTLGATAADLLHLGMLSFQQCFNNMPSPPHVSDSSTPNWSSSKGSTVHQHPPPPNVPSSSAAALIHRNTQGHPQQQQYHKQGLQQQPRGPDWHTAAQRPPLTRILAKADIASMTALHRLKIKQQNHYHTSSSTPGTPTTAASCVGLVNNSGHCGGMGGGSSRFGASPAALRFSKPFRSNSNGPLLLDHDCTAAAASYANSGAGAHSGSNNVNRTGSMTPVQTCMSESGAYHSLSYNDACNGMNRCGDEDYTYMSEGEILSGCTGSMEGPNTSTPETSWRGRWSSSSGGVVVAYRDGHRDTSHTTVSNTNNNNMNPASCSSSNTTGMVQHPGGYNQNPQHHHSVVDDSV